MVNYSEDHKNKILIRTFEGKVTIIDLFTSWEELLSDRSFTKKFNALITDYR